MKKQNKWRTIAGLTLGLCLVAAQALAWSFRIINSSGGSVKVNCSTTNIPSADWPASGETKDYTCSSSSGSGTAFVQRPGGNPEYTIPNDCGSDEIKATTVTAGATAGTLVLSHQCASS